MKLYLDTNAITKAGHRFAKTEYVKIAKLCSNQGYSVIMHEVAKKEVETQITEQLTKDIASAESAARRISSKATTPRVISKMKEIAEHFIDHNEELIRDKLKPFHDWLVKCKAEIIPISSTNAEAVFMDYFEGKGAFSGVKSRKDLPDGFILEGLRALADESDSIVVISDDTPLARAAEASGFNIIFKKLDDFLESNMVKDVNFDFFLDHLRIAFDDNVFEKIVASDYFKQFIEKCVEEHDWNDVVLDEDSESEPRIVGIGNTHNLEIELLDVDGMDIRVRCNFDADVDLEYFVYKGDACCMSDEDISQISFTDWNKHVFLASISTTLSLEIECGVYVNEDFSFSAGESLEHVIISMLGDSSGGVEHVLVSSWRED